MSDKEMLEKDVEREVCKYAEGKGLLQYKFSSPAHAGVPDRLFIVGVGQVFFIEFKRKGGVPTPLQVREAGKIISRGVRCYLVDGVEEGKEIINNECSLVATMTGVVDAVIGHDPKGDH